MEKTNALNFISILKDFLVFLQTYTKTKFGAGVVGFLLACVISYFIIIEKDETIRSLRAENEQLKIANSAIRIEAQKEAREYIDFAFSLVQKIREEISDIKDLESKEDLLILEEKMKNNM